MEQSVGNSWARHNCFLHVSEMVRYQLLLSQLRHLRSSARVVNPMRIPLENEPKQEDFDADREFRRLKSRFLQSRQSPTVEIPNNRDLNPWAKEFRSEFKSNKKIIPWSPEGKSESNLQQNSRDHKRPATKLYSLIPLVDGSPTLKLLVEMGVNLGELERKENAADLIVKLNIDRDIKPMLIFLTQRVGNGSSLRRFVNFVTLIDFN